MSFTCGELMKQRCPGDQLEFIKVELVKVEYAQRFPESPGRTRFYTAVPRF